MTFESKWRYAPSTRMERTGAWSIVIAIHVLVAWMVTRPTAIEGRSGPPMELVYIQLPPPSPKQVRKIAAPQGQPEHPRAARLDQPHGTTPNLGTTVVATKPTLPATSADDHWDLPGRVSEGEPIAFGGTDPMHRINPIQVGPPERFRMRGQLSPADIVRIVSMGLFWPPGYSDNPCGGIEKIVQTLSGASTARERSLFEDAVKQQQRYCM